MVARWRQKALTGGDQQQIACSRASQAARLEHLRALEQADVRGQAAREDIVYLAGAPLRRVHEACPTGAAELKGVRTGEPCEQVLQLRVVAVRTKPWSECATVTTPSLASSQAS